MSTVPHSRARSATLDHLGVAHHPLLHQLGCARRAELKLLAHDPRLRRGEAGKAEPHRLRRRLPLAGHAVGVAHMHLTIT